MPYYETKPGQPGIFVQRNLPWLSVRAEEMMSIADNTRVRHLSEHDVELGPSADVPCPDLPESLNWILFHDLVVRSISDSDKSDGDDGKSDGELSDEEELEPN
jgi:hypothetical protein